MSSAWYELVPAASQAIMLSAAAGDRIRAAVTVSGHHVAVTLSDLTRHHSFTKRLHAATVDTSAKGSAFTVTYRGGVTQTAPVHPALVAGDRVTRPALSPSSEAGPTRLCRGAPIV